MKCNFNWKITEEEVNISQSLTNVRIINKVRLATWLDQLRTHSLLFQSIFLQSQLPGERDAVAKQCVDVVAHNSLQNDTFFDHNQIEVKIQKINRLERFIQERFLNS